MNINVTQALRPIRLAFMIQPNTKASYMRALRICSLLWGGKYFPIFPIFRKFTEAFRKEYQVYESPLDFYIRAIENFDPDYIVIGKNVERGFIEKIKGDRDIISISDIEEHVMSGDSQYGISIDDIIISLKDSEFKYGRNDSLKIVLPQVRNNDIFSATLFGSAVSGDIDKLKKIEFPRGLLSFQLLKLHDFAVYSDENVMHFLNLSNRGIYVFGNQFWTSKTAIYILNHNRLNDLNNFWNLRALGWNIIAVPYETYNHPVYVKQIEKLVIDFRARGGLSDDISVISGFGIGEKIVNDIIKFLTSIEQNFKKKIRYSHHWWFPRFWMEKKNLDFDKTASVLFQSKMEKHIVNFDNEQIRLHVLHPEFGLKYSRHTAPRYINQISYEFDDIEAKYAQALPLISSKKLDFVIKASGFNQWRFSENGIFFLAKESDIDLAFKIPIAKDVFEEWFGEKDYIIQYSAAGRLSNQLLRNIGGVYGTNFFTTPGILPVLALFENGRIVKSKTLFTELSKQKQHFRQKNLNEVVARLIEKNIIQFGVELQCSLCNQYSFYVLADFRESVLCTVCHNMYTVPLHSPSDIAWAYRGIGPFSRNNKSEGIIPVLLVLRFFRIGLHSKNITPLLSFEIYKNKALINEVDFGVFYSKFGKSFSSSTPDLFFCECKTIIDFTQKDIDRMDNLAQLFPGCILVFVTLKKGLSNSEKKLITSLAKKTRKGLGSRPSNPVLILTGNELLNWLSYDSQWKHLIIPHMQFEDEVGHLCDVTTQYYLSMPSYSIERHKRLEAKRKPKTS